MAQTPQAGAHIECVERLQVPSFGPVAQAAKQVGTVEARITVGKEGTVTQSSIELTSPDPRLADEVKMMILLSKFSRRCDRQIVRLRFTFIREEGEPVDYPVPLIIFLPPNEFEIRSLPKRFTVDRAPSR